MSDNNTSRQFTKKRRQGGLMNALKSGKLYEEYIKHPTAQYKMSFSEYKKKKNRKMLSDGPDPVSTGQ